MASTTTNIESLQQEGRTFPPPSPFAQAAHIKSAEQLEQLRVEARRDPEQF